MPSIEVHNLPFWKKAVFTLIPLGVFLILLEFGLRLTVPFQQVRPLCFHPIMQRDYCPNVKGSIKYGVTLKVNSDGMIDQDHPVARAPGKLRVAVLGDSFTAGEEVGMGKRFHEIWETRLGPRLGREVEFLNFGVRGFGTWEELQMFHLKAAKYHPDLVIVNFLWLNDVDDNINNLQKNAYNPLKEDYPQNTLWQRILVSRKNFNKWLWNHSITYQWFRTHYNKFELWVKNLWRPGYKQHLKRVAEFRAGHQKPGKPTPGQQGDPNSSPGKESTSHPATLATDTESIHDDLFFTDSAGWKITRLLFKKLKAEVEAAGGKLAVIHFPAENQMHGYPGMPRHEFNRFLRKNQISPLDLFSKYAALSREEVLRTTFMREHGDHHFSEYGHRVYAGFTEDFLFSLLRKIEPPA
ncbi:MAG: SGNH/GDSL hydrolase family protein [Nitrospinaceae bacterium]